MQGLHLLAVDGGSRADDGLGEELATEDAAEQLGRLGRHDEAVVSDGLQLQRLQKVVQ